MTGRPSADPTDLVALLRSSEVFGWLSEDQLGPLAACMSLVALDDGDVLIEQDQAATELYVVLAGALDVTSVDGRGSLHALGDLEAGNVFGELALFSATPAIATVRARGSVQLARLGKAGFEHFGRCCPAGALHVLEALRPRLRRHQLRVALQRSDMFGPMDPIALLDLESEFELVALYGGEVLFRQGDTADSLYFVISGRLRVVSVAADGSETLLAELGTGETVGEMAVLSGEPRSATVYAIRDTQLAKLSKTSVGRVVSKHPHATLLMLTGRLISRVRNMSTAERRRPSLSTIAVVPASPGVPLTEFSGRLATALATLGRTLHLTSSVVDASLGRAGVAQAHDRDGGGSGLLEWLTELEGCYRYVVYQSDKSLSPWSERCVRQADRVILVANAAEDADTGEIEAEIINRRPAGSAPVTLALVHDDGAAVPSGTMRWLAPRMLERHLHVRRKLLADYDRVARFLAGGAVGLALGGGFARGLAHLGVFRAFDELDIPIDAIGGSSMGAMIGAQWVIGREPSHIIQDIQRGFADSFDDMTLPFLSFKRGGRISTFVRQMFQDVRIEDLWTPFFCVSANLNRAELKVHTSGSLADALLASSRAPGIFPPMVIDGELHVDGGVINNVPVDVMKTFSNNGLAVGVDVSPPHELNHVADYGEDIPGWQAIWNRFNPTREKRIYRPSILLVLMRVIEFGGISYRRQKAEAADVYISPEIVRFKRNDFHAASEIVETGYQASRKRLEEWLQAAPPSVRSRRPDLFSRLPGVSLHEDFRT
jgi:NTE family protein/lysophospholipid hydrolase